jgi:hypothetical protein
MIFSPLTPPRIISVWKKLAEISNSDYFAKQLGAGQTLPSPRSSVIKASALDPTP